MTGPLAISVAGELERHAIDLAVLGCAAAIAALRPRIAPYLVVPGVLLQSSATHLMTSDGLVLAGTAAGLAVHRARRGSWPGPADVPAALVVLLVLDALMAASLVANRGGPAQSVATQTTGYFASRSVLMGAVVVLATGSAVGLRDWLAAGALGSLAVAGARLLEILGVPVQAVAGSLSIHLMGDLNDVGSWNAFATLMVAGGIAALATAIGWPSSRRTMWLWTAVAIIVVAAGATAQSRTATVIVLVLFPLLAVCAAGRLGRTAIVGVGAAFLAVALTPAGSILDKPIVVTVARSSGTTGAAPPAPAVPAPSPTIALPTTAAGDSNAPSFQAERRPPAVDWRSVLDRPYYRIDQVFAHPTTYAHGNYVAVLVRSTGDGSDVRLRVAVNGRRIADVGTDRMKPDYQWLVVPIPDGAMTSGRAVTLSFSATGSLDSRHYISIGGTNGFAIGITSRAYSHGRFVANDLSADPGVQRGLFIAFLDDEVPAITPSPPGARAVLDPSLSDRLSLWSSAWRIFVAHPLLGTGFYTFGSLHDRYSDSALFFAYDNAHSNYLELLADLGALGPVLLLLLIGVAGAPLLVRAARGRQHRWRDLALAAVVGVALLASGTQTWIGDSRLAMFFTLLLLVASGEARPALILSGIALARRRLGVGAAPAAAPLE